MHTIGERLLTLKAYSGLSLAEIARRGGYKGASSIQKLFQRDYAPEFLPDEVAAKLIRAFVGAGDPPIREEELRGLTSGASEIENLVSQLSHYVHLTSELVPLFKTSKMKDSVVTNGGVDIPLFEREVNNNGLHFPAPQHLRGRQLIGMYVSVGCMWPRFEEGEVVFYEHSLPPSKGDDVVVTVFSSLNLEGGMIIGRLVLLNDNEVQLALLSPRDFLSLPRNTVRSIYRIPARAEMLESPRSVL